MSGVASRIGSAIPLSMKHRISLRRVQLLRFTSFGRPMPSFMIIGAQRGGTSSLYKYLEGHPDLAASSRKETQYFSRRFSEGEGWYRAHFPWSLGSPRPRLAFEATPDYLFYPPTPERVSARLPDARFIVLLRDPVARAVSHFQHMTRLGFEHVSFSEALLREQERIAADQVALDHDALYYSQDLLRFSYAARGRYAEQLARWFGLFDRSRFLILRSEDLFTDPARTFSSVVSFLGVRSWQPKRFENHSRRAGTSESAGRHRDRDAEALLGVTLQADIRTLEEMLDRSMDWELGGSM